MALTRLSVLLFAFVLLYGCADDGKANAATKETLVVALDTSTSAKDIHEELYNRIIRLLEETPRSTRLVVFRFDSATAEIYDGPAINDGAQAGRTLKPEMQWQSNTTGTNLARLLARIDKSISGSTDKVVVHVFTDCGTEEMTKADEQQVREITAAWKTAGNVEMKFHGVKTGFREKLRDLVALHVEID